MTFDVTTEMPSTKALLREDDYEAADRAVAAVAVPLERTPAPTDRLLGFVKGLTSTPRRSSMLTVWVFAAVVMAITWLAQPTRSVRTALGPARVSCGLDVYVYGYPDRAVASACRRAEGLNAGLFVPSALIVLAGLAAVGVLAFGRSTQRSPEDAASLVGRLREVPASAGLVLLGVAAGIVGLFALRPSLVTHVNDGVLVTARCGADSYFGFLSRYPDPSIAKACSSAYSGRAHVLEICVLLVLLAAAVLLQLAYSKAVPGWQKLRTTVVLAAAALGIVTLVALAPVAVSVRGGSTPELASCGIDTFLAGYPDQAVQNACRANYGGHAAVGLSAGAGALTVACWGAIEVNRRRYSKRDVVSKATREAVL